MMVGLDSGAPALPAAGSNSTSLGPGCLRHALLSFGETLFLNRGGLLCLFLWLDRRDHP